RLVASVNGGAFRGYLGLSKLLYALMTKKLPFRTDQLEDFIRSSAANRKSGYWGELALPTILRMVEEEVGSGGMGGSLRSALEELAASLRRDTSYADARKLLARIETLLVHHDNGDGQSRKIGLATDEAWTNHLRQVVESLGDQQL